ncbi:NAD(P)-dependent oxidoreductase [Streptomyces sp. NPDC048483]|uniref:NAD-dependent epimerase/dehydratase family protein n=1 Tax=Streptomyces sp. NPDC048483 TaxID=3154927 RepID=UPI0034240AB7
MVVVTGSSGLVGSAPAAAFDAAGWVVRGVDRAPGCRTSVIADLRDRHVRRAALQSADVLVHAAALHAPHVGRLADEEFRAVNVGMTAELLDNAARLDVRRVLYISSTSVYRHALVPTDRAVWVDEQLTPLPRDIYDETKLAAEDLVAACSVSSVTLRTARCLPEPLPVLARHLLHRAVDVADVATAGVLAVTHAAAAGTFNISGPHPFHRDDCLALHRDAGAVLAGRAPDVFEAFRDRGWPVPDRLDRVYDSAAAANTFGYRPVRGVRQLLRDAADGPSARVIRRQSRRARVRRRLSSPACPFPWARPKPTGQDPLNNAIAAGSEPTGPASTRTSFAGHSLMRRNGMESEFARELQNSALPKSRQPHHK